MSQPHPRGPAFLFDLDGTLVDSVYQHVLAWREALEERGIELDVWRIHRRIGMSGGLFVNALLREMEEPMGEDDVRRVQDLMPPPMPGWSIRCGHCAGHVSCCGGSQSSACRGRLRPAATCAAPRQCWRCSRCGRRQRSSLGIWCATPNPTPNSSDCRRKSGGRERRRGGRR